ncbi:hypothetical protein ElyMa_006710800 [Elysia marginata]|uniref:Homing endonuclease LAGLIDADG domain-containing protein n=1 Tax=Elysia marginata TaxID=1093978 RepID=A0AAV4IW58_9GAST|nr:hypothetical protein ElyMa_006710800 [Elysia marginata]
MEMEQLRILGTLLDGSGWTHILTKSDGEMMDAFERYLGSIILTAPIPMSSNLDGKRLPKIKALTKYCHVKQRSVNMQKGLPIKQAMSGQAASLGFRRR